MKRKPKMDVSGKGRNILLPSDIITLQVGEFNKEIGEYHRLKNVYNSEYITAEKQI